MLLEGFQIGENHTSKIFLHFTQISLTACIVGPACRPTTCLCAYFSPGQGNTGRWMAYVVIMYSGWEWSCSCSISFWNLDQQMNKCVICVIHNLNSAQLLHIACLTLSHVHFHFQFLLNTTHPCIQTTLSPLLCTTSAHRRYVSPAS